MSLDFETTTGQSTTSTSSPVARAGSPTAARKALGKPTPPPLSFEPSLHQTSSDALPSGITNLTSPPYSAPSKQRNSPFTPDRPSPSGRSRAQRSPLSPMDSQTRPTAGWNGTRRVASDGNEKNIESSDGYRSVEGVNRSGKLPASASSASLSGRPRNAQSVLGYSSLAKKGLSPGRGSKSEGLSGGVAVSPAPQGANNSSRYLLTVIPPSHLPHDPPHPRTNPQCSGYGPPEHFKRGTLVPLYPTLSSQLAAIAREYGLPSTGGLVVYLLNTFDPSSAVPQPLPGSAGFAGEGGPRISEAAWSLLWSRLFEEEEEVYLVAEDTLSDDEDYAPPVPPIPRSHQALDDDDSRSRQPSDEQAIFSADEDHERTSLSSDADDASSKYDKSEGRQASGSGGSRSFSTGQNGIGRGPPPSLPSPDHGPRPSHRFSQSQQRYVSLPTTANSANQRQSSRNSLRSARTGLPAYYYPSPAQSRSASYGSYAPSHVSTPPTPGYGASVIVGKVEFDIDRSRAQGGKGKWYDAWVEGAVPAEATPPVALGTEVPATTNWQELQLPELVKSKTNNPPEPYGFNDSFTPPFSTDDNHDTRTRTISGTSRGMESATSAWSLAAMAERVEQREARQAQDIEEEENQGEDSIVDKEPITSERSTSPLRSRPLSNASTAVLESDKDTEETEEEEEEEVQDQGYSQLEDDEESEPLKAGSFSDDSEEQAGSDESSEYGGTGGQEEEEVAKAVAEGRDPLGDIFESDEATWQSLAADSSRPRLNVSASIETTGLGIVGTRIAELAPTAPEGVLERSSEEQASLESEQSLPPQDDVAEVFSMLHSAQAAATSSGPLASPIRLEHSPGDSSESVTFPPSRELDDSESRQNSPFTMSHSTNTSVSTVNFNVRPPSTIASMSPEYVPQRKQRQGWTNVPAVIDPSLSTSSSSSSIALLDSQRASTIGLMENLDDLERALAELSPRANKAKATQQAEAIPEEPTPPASDESHTSTTSFPRPPRSSSRDVSAEDQGGPTRFEPSSHLSPSVEERPGLLSTSSYASEESFVTAVAPETSPVVEPIRIPRSSSLSKARMEEGQPPHLVALPPSPLPPSPSSMNSNEAADDHTPKVDTSEWSTLPPSPPRLPVALPESDLPPVPPKVEDVAPFAASSPSTTRSPGPIKSLRMNKPWSSKESRTIKTQPSPDPSTEEPSVPKSPLGAFFGKSTFGKAKGFFKKSESSQEGHASTTSPATSPNLPASSLPNESAPTPVRKDSLDVPSYTLPAIERMNDSTATQAPAEPTPLAHPIPTPFASIAESVHSGPSSRPDSPFYNEATPDYPPGTSTTSPPVLSPGSTLSPTSTSFPQPPSTRPFATSPSTSDFHLSSPRSEYIPQTPRAGFATSPSNTSQYPASAPVTPAEWPNSRFGAASTPGSDRGKRKPRLSADIDQLLSQMNDIDFSIGGDDDDDEDDYGAPEKDEQPSKEVKREESEVVSPLLVEPSTNPLDFEGEQSGGSSQSHEHRPQDSGMLGVQGNAHRGILSADLSALGSMMTGFASPPLSPDQSTSSLHHVS